MALTPDEFRKTGHGKVAPWVDLVNSEEWDTYGRRTEWLGDPSWLRFFLAAWRFPAPDRARFPAAKVKALRSAIRKSCESLDAAERIPEKELHALNSALNVAGKRQLIHGQNGWQVQFVPRSEGWEPILSEIALSFASRLGDGASRIKSC